MINDKYIIGHRGIGNKYIDNSIRSILYALYHKCDLIEIDVRMSKDNNFFLYHDEEISLLTFEKDNQNNEIITNIEEENTDLLTKNYINDLISSINLISSKSIPLLDIKILKKYENDKEYLINFSKKLLNLLNKIYFNYNKIFISSFNSNIIDIIIEQNNQENSKLFFGKIIDNNNIIYEDIINSNYDFISIDKNLNDLEKILELIKNNYKIIFLYTIKEKHEFDKFLKFKSLDGIITDIPYN